jgi:hypothetical protein
MAEPGRGQHRFRADFFIPSLESDTPAGRKKALDIFIEENAGFNQWFTRENRYYVSLHSMNRMHPSKNIMCCQ